MVQALHIKYRLLINVLLHFVYKTTSPYQTYTLSLHDALPIYLAQLRTNTQRRIECRRGVLRDVADQLRPARSEEHTSELQSHVNLVCRLLLEKKKIKHDNSFIINLVILIPILITITTTINTYK